MEGLFFLLIVLGLITLIGLSIWIFLGFIHSHFTGDKNKSADSCSECGASIDAFDNYCAVCGRKRGGQENEAVLNELASTVRRFLDRGQIDYGVYQAMMRAVEEERERIDPAKQNKTQVNKDALPIEIVQHTIARESQPTAANSPAVHSKVEAVIQIDSKDDEPAIDVFSNDNLPARPRRSFAEMLGGFMEESSIQWGEIVGGLLIIGCSIALVISLWSQIASVPILKFSVFIGVTSAMFGLGFYSAHRWKLPTTSRGVLIISTLLVPLNFLAITAFSRGDAPTSALVIGGELFALALFSFLVYQASRVITPGCEWMLTGAVLGPSFAMLLTQHWRSSNAAAPMYALLGAAPLTFYWGSVAATLRRLKSLAVVGEDELKNVFVSLGIASFAALLPFGLLLVKLGNFTPALRQCAPLVSLFGAPAVAVGLTVLQKIGDRRAGEMRTAATSVGFIGSLASLTALAIAWPNPISVLMVASINCVICAAAARQFNLKIAHAFLIAHLLIAFLIGVNLFAGNIAPWQESGLRLMSNFVSATSGKALILLFSLLAAASELWRRGGKKDEEQIYVIAAILVGSLSLALVSLHGFGRAGDPHHAVLIYVFYSTAAFIVAWRRDEAIAAWVGSGLAASAVVQAMVFKFGEALSPYHPVRLSMLTSASAAAVAAVVLKTRGAKAQRLYVSPLTGASLAYSLAVTPFVLFGGWMSSSQMSGRLMWLAAIWLLLSCVNCWPLLFTVFRAALTLSVIFGVAAVVEHYALPSSPAFLDPVMLQAQGIALALLCIIWASLRLTLRRYGVTGAVSQLVNPHWPPRPRFDQLVTVATVFLLFGLSLCGATVGIIEELTPGQALSPAIREFSTKALGTGSWIFISSMAIALVIGLWERFERRIVLTVIIVGFCVCLLLAGQWQTQNSVASACRWLAAFGFALTALPILFRERVFSWCQQFDWPEMTARSQGLTNQARNLSIALFVTAVLWLTLDTFAAVESGHKLISKASLVIPLIVISLTFIAHAVRERSSHFVLAAGLTLNLAVTLVSLVNVELVDATALIRLAHLNIMTISAFSLLWIASARFGLKFEHQNRAITMISIISIAGIFLTQFVELLAGARENWPGWLAVAAIAALLTAWLWDDDSELALPGLYAIGALAVCRVFTSLLISNQNLIAVCAIALAVYALAMSILWRNHEFLVRLAGRIRMPRRADGVERTHSWLSIGNSSIAIAVVLLTFRVIFSFNSLSLRLAVASCAFALPVSIALLTSSSRNQRLITFSVRLFILSALLWSWAWFDPSNDLQMNNRLITVMIIAEIFVIGYKLWAVGRFSFLSRWREAMRAEISWIAVVGLTTLAVLLFVELLNYMAAGSSMMSWPAVIAMLATLIGLSLASLAFALLPGQDPFGFDEKGQEQKKMGYIYAAELFIALTLLHARVTMPWLFGGLFRAYWPLIVMGLAFLGVSLSEMFRRQGRLVLVEPLERTGVILPLLPVIGFWVAGSEVSYSGLLLLVGLFYGVLSVMRRSFVFGLLAAVAGNSGLWHFLNGVDGYGFFEHPQLWLIPAALSVLAAAKINQDRLSQDQMTSIRYATLVVIYVSSTADIFINGVSESPWLSVVLAALSVTGVIAGLLLRVRAFLFLGMAFLLLAVLTMIWTASVNLGWQWLWYVTGIAFGVLIIYAFAMFERKRGEMLKLVEQLKSWQG